MNSRQIVNLIADADYIPVMYGVIECTVGATTALSYAWLEVIGYGITTEAELNILKASKLAGTKPDFSVLHGTKGTYTVVALSLVEEYVTPDTLLYGDKNIGCILM